MVKNTMIISILTMFSRILGLIRDTIIAMVFGTGIVSDAFFLAFKPFDLVRKLFSEGILAGSFVPEFTKTCQEKGKSGGVGLLYAVLFVLSVFAALVMLAAVFLAPLVLGLMAPEFEHNSEIGRLTVLLFNIMLPYFWFIMATGLLMGALNAMGYFAVPGAMPALFNLVVIGFIFIAISFFHTPVTGLAAGVCTGGAVQFSILFLCFIKLNSLKQVLIRSFFPKAVGVVKKMLPTMVGTAGFQINMVIAAFFATTLDTGSVACLYFSERLVQLPLALFAVSAATVALPEYSKIYNAGDFERLNNKFSNALKILIFITIPASAGLMALDQSIVSVLFERGRFDDEAVFLTAKSLFFLAPGLCAFSGIRICSTLFFAMNRVWLPFVNGMFMIGLNCVLSIILLPQLGIAGLVISVSISALVGFLVLFFCIPGQVKIDRLAVLLCACRSLFLSAIMFELVQIVNVISGPSGQGSSGQIPALAGSVCVGVLFYFTAGLLVSKKELKLLLKGLINKKHDHL